jgi:hypothetical protein
MNRASRSSIFFRCYPKERLALRKWDESPIIAWSYDPLQIGDQPGILDQPIG